MQIKNDVVPSGAASFCYERLVVVNGLSCKCRLIGQKVCVAFLN